MMVGGPSARPISDSRPWTFYALGGLFAAYLLFLYGPMFVIYVLSFQGERCSRTNWLRLRPERATSRSNVHAPGAAIASRPPTSSSGKDARTDCTIASAIASRATTAGCASDWPPDLLFSMV